MKTSLLTVCALAAATALSAQTTILDFETEETSANYQYFENGDLNGTSAAIIDNPDPTGINTSANVLELVERGVDNGGQSFTGVFPNPTHQRAVDLTTATQVCVDVWMPEISTVSVKLEEGTSSNWIRTIANTTTNAWEQLCFDTSLPGLENPMIPAAGNTYNKVVLFTGLNEIPAEDLTYYFDNVIVQEGTTSQVDVTFSVDVNDFDGDVASVGVAGTFNDFTASDNLLTDEDEDGIYEGTFEFASGTYEYLFVVNGDQFESLATTAECVKVTIGGAGEVFVNRESTFVEDVTLGTVAFGSCYARGESVDITFNVGTSNIVVDDSGVYIAGGGNFGNPGDFRLTDEDEDGVYTITFERQRGFNSFYAFTNGACPNYSCKEQLGGLPCGDPENFNDRSFPGVTQDTVISACFGSCETDTGACGLPAQPAEVTFAVDMREYEGEFEAVFLAGTFSAWNASDNPMSDEDEDGIWTITVNMPGGVSEYKFVAGDVYEEGITAACGTGENGNRTVAVDGEPITLDAACYGSCDACQSSSVGDLAGVGVAFAIRPTVAVNEVALDFGRSLESATVRIFDVSGKALRTVELAGVTSHVLDVSGLTAGYYMVQLDYAGARGVRRVVKQ